MKTGIELIAEERRRQIEEEGWSESHDYEHWDESLAKAASCYALPGEDRICDGEIPVPENWPWEPQSWKPARCEFKSDNNYISERIRELQKAGALIAAEIDRLNSYSERIQAPKTIDDFNKGDQFGYFNRVLTLDQFLEDAGKNVVMFIDIDGNICPFSIETTNEYLIEGTLKPLHQ